MHSDERWQVPWKLRSGTFFVPFANTDGPELSWAPKQHLFCDGGLVESAGLDRWSTEPARNKLLCRWRRMAALVRRKPPPSPPCSDPAPGNQIQVEEYKVLLTNSTLVINMAVVCVTTVVLGHVVVLWKCCPEGHSVHHYSQNYELDHHGPP